MTSPIGVEDVFYCLREDVKQALDVKETARSNRQIDRAIRSASRGIEGQMVRRFYPLQTTAKFDWPPLPYSGAFPWRLWLDEMEVISVSALVSGGVTINPSGYLLEPVNAGPPYTHIDINIGTSSSFSSGATWQQSTLVTGVFGYTAETEPAATLAAAVTDTTSSTVTVTASAVVGVGSILLIDTERMMVTGRSMTSTAQTLQADLAANVAVVTVAVSDGTKYVQDETILVDAERMLIVDIAGNNLIVKRAWDGSVLAAHTTGATIYAARMLTVRRGALGTTAATHLINAPVLAHVVPGTIRNLAVAESVTQLLNEEAGYARTVGSGDNVRTASGAQLKDLRSQALTQYGRQARTRAV